MNSFPPREIYHDNIKYLYLGPSEGRKGIYKEVDENNRYKGQFIYTDKDGFLYDFYIIERESGQVIIKACLKI